MVHDSLTPQPYSSPLSRTRVQRHVRDPLIAAFIAGILLTLQGCASPYAKSLSGRDSLSNADIEWLKGACVYGDVSDGKVFRGYVAGKSQAVVNRAVQICRGAVSPMSQHKPLPWQPSCRYDQVRDIHSCSMHASSSAPGSASVYSPSISLYRDGIALFRL